MIKEAIIKLSKKEDLTYEMAEAVMDEIMSGEAGPVQPTCWKHWESTSLSRRNEARRS